MTQQTATDEDSEDRRSLWKAWTIAIVIAAAGIALTLPFVGDAPPREIRVATGPAGGGYAAAGEHLKRRMADSGITVELIETAGSRENLDRLTKKEVDVAFVQGGVYQPAAAIEGEPDESGIIGLASLYYEPLWVFTRDEPPHELGQLAGRRVQVGSEGSGTRSVALAILEACGAEPTGANLLGDGPPDAVRSLLAGEADALFLVTAPSSPQVHELFEATEDGRVHAMSLERAHSLSRHFRFLRPLVLTPGLIDLDRDLPREAVDIVAATASLIADADLHPALVPILIGAMESRYHRGRLFEGEGEFPSGLGLDFPLSLAAERYYTHGRSFLYRIFPFQLAAALDRLKILLLPLVTLLLPLIRVAPPLYRWRIRSRIFKWYQKIMQLESRLRTNPSPDSYALAEAELQQLDQELRDVNVPLSYAEELYNLRMHTRLVRKDVEARMHGAEGASAELG